MCNLSKGVEERGIAKGREIEREEEMLRSIKNLMKSMSWTVEKAMDALMVPETDRIRFRKELNK